MMFFFQEGVFFFQSQLGDLDLFFFLQGTSKVFTQFIFRHLNLGILQNDCAGKSRIPTTGQVLFHWIWGKSGNSFPAFKHVFCRISWCYPRPRKVKKPLNLLIFLGQKRAVDLTLPFSTFFDLGSTVEYGRWCYIHSCWAIWVYYPWKSRTLKKIVRWNCWL